MNVLVFKTNVSKPAQVKKVQALLTAIPAVSQWNFDLEDCDNILRVVSATANPRHIESMLWNEGIICCELP